MTGLLITFSNLFPSAARPLHGLFVADRMRRVVLAAGLDWVVVSPRPAVPRLLRRDIDRTHAQMPRQEQVDGVSVHHPAYFHLPGISARKQAKRIARAALPVVAELVAGRECVLDAHYVYPDGVAALDIARQLELPCTVTARGTDINVLAEDAAIGRQIRAFAGGAHALFAVSRELRDRFARVAGLAKEQVYLARNGVDLDRFHPGDPGSARRELGLPKDARLVLAVGRLVAEKGFHLMARALRNLEQSVHMVVVGVGPEAPRLVQLAPEGRLHLLGPLTPERVALCYQACDLLVLPSEREGWPNVVTEALASGLPVVATPVGGIPDMISSPRVGSMVRGGDSRALGSEVARWLASHRDQAAIHDFARRFTWDETVDLHVEQIKRALQPRRTVRMKPEDGG